MRKNTKLIVLKKILTFEHLLFFSTYNNTTFIAALFTKTNKLL